MPNAKDTKSTEAPPAPAVAVPNATTIMQRIDAVLEQLERGGRGAREQLKEVPDDSTAVESYVEACILMESPPIALHHVARRPIMAEAALAALAEALDAGRIVLAGNRARASSLG
jgi:hypothetical protein